MKTIFMNAQNLPSVQKQATPCVMALGYFDGVHLGHQQVIQHAYEEAKRRGLPLALMSFRPHPIFVLSGGKRLVPHLTTLCQKQKILAKLGVDLFYLVEFTPKFAKLSPQKFVQDYLLGLEVTHAVAGFDFSYGAKGSARLNQIPADSDGLITVTEVDCLAHQGEKISSTAIRQRLLSAKVDEIRHFLGKDYFVKTTWNGHKFMLIEDTMLPAPGIYEAELEGPDRILKSIILVDEQGELHPLESKANLLRGTIIIHLLRQVKTSLSSQTFS
ncbi:FAD synthase [Mesobacillus campisalis]|uniref:FAD synthase n=1 Tax=Mesobacillus campisalis TaxID=1408103 RepID=A0A0M2SV28_9BACI|nr:FAD synthetase family protein [Mesobacillus campisalis]KKK36485.1 FAD synthase [Mesobacillus campisalis]